MKVDFSLSLKADLRLIIEKALIELASEIGLSPSSLKKVKEKIQTLEIESIREEKFGDYACTAAMEKSFRELYSEANTEFRNPRNFASSLCLKLKENKETQKILERIEIAGPGFINLSLKASALMEYMIQMREKKEKLLLLPKEKREKIILEYVSANPTGPLNIVSARAASLGDTCANLCEAVGHEVTREYYVNDYGNQLLLLGQSLFLRHLESLGCHLKFARQDENGNSFYPDESGLPFPKEAYHGEYIKEIAQKLEKEGAFAAFRKEKAEKIEELKKVSRQKKSSKGLDTISSFIEEEELGSLVQALGRKAVAILLEKQKQSLKKFRVSFDHYFHESILHKEGKITKAQKKLEKEGLCYEKEGAIFFQSTKYGDDKDRVLIRKDQRPSYFLSDIAYHLDKMERGFKKIYNIWGPDHHGYIARLAGAIQALGYTGLFQVIIAQQVNLLEGGRALRMSKRAGRTLSLEELIEEVPLDVARYFFVMRSFTAPMDFDLAVAKDESEKNPYYYVAYAHARIASISRRAKQEGLRPLSTQELRAFLAISKDEETLKGEKGTLWEWSPQRRRLLLQTLRFIEETQAAAEALEPHRLLHYLYTLANFLSQFYAPKENRVIQQEPQTAGCLLAILETVAFCLKKGLNLLGAEAPERLLREEGESPTLT